MGVCAHKTAPPLPIHTNFQLSFQLTGDVRVRVGQALPRGFPDTRRASDYLVITRLLPHYR